LTAGLIPRSDDSPQPMVTLFVVEARLIYLDKAKDGGFAAYEDGFSLLQLTRQYYRDAGLDAGKLDALIR
jgi:2,4'-dihydroxyacetophenone dioxygenase